MSDLNTVLQQEANIIQSFPDVICVTGELMTGYLTKDKLKNRFHEILGKINEHPCIFGPGSSRCEYKSRSIATLAEKVNDISGLDLPYPFRNSAFRSMSDTYHSEHNPSGIYPEIRDVGEYSILKHRNVAMFAKVPKDIRGDRFISIEPSSLAYVQQGARFLLIERMKEQSFWSDINIFEGQQFQQNRLKQDARAATIDLKDASEYISLAILDLLPDDWKQLLLSARSHSMIFSIMENRESMEFVVNLRKFAGQGNAVVFPLQTLFFYLLLTTADYYHNRTGKRQKQPKVSVYGDDIIIHENYVQTASLILEAAGLRVNKRKSFRFPFRESCGLDLFEDMDITPLRRKFGTPKTSGEISAITGPMLEHIRRAKARGLNHLAEYHESQLTQLTKKLKSRFFIPRLSSDIYPSLPATIAEMLQMQPIRFHFNSQDWEIQISQIILKPSELKYRKTDLSVYPDRLLLTLLYMDNRIKEEYDALSFGRIVQRTSLSEVKSAQKSWVSLSNFIDINARVEQFMSMFGLSVKCALGCLFCKELNEIIGQRLHECNVKTQNWCPIGCSCPLRKYDELGWVQQ
jgi:hypothetical protein